MATAVETIKNFMSALTNYSQDTTSIGKIALDAAIRQSTIYYDLDTAISDFKDRLADTKTYPDTDTRLRELTGMVLGNVKDLNVDTGSISGYNAGGAYVKNAQDIVPEIGDMSTATLPVPGSTTPITYTGEDGTSHTFYVKWPDSFTTVVQGFDATATDNEARLDDSYYNIDLNTLDPNAYYARNNKDENGNVTSISYSPTYGQMKSSMETILKGMNTWWLRESAKLNYDSLGLALDGQTIEFKFIVGGYFDDIASAITFSRRTDYLPSNFITVAINLFSYGNLDSNNPNGAVLDSDGTVSRLYLDRVVAHEMVHAVMQATGTLKDNMPKFFTEGVADLVVGDDDYNSGSRDDIINLVNDSKTLAQALNYTSTSLKAYPAGDMFLRFLAKQNLETTAIVGDPNQAQTFDFNGKLEVITNYVEADTINYNTDFTGAYPVTNDFIALAGNSGYLVMRDVRGKLMTFTNSAGGTAYAYMSENAGEVDGRNINGGNNYDILFGANYENNVLRAGNAGSYLWGGNRGNDELFGGAGVDTFVYKIDGGKDTIHNAESQDIVVLSGIESAKFSVAQINDNGVNFQFRDGGTLTVEGQPSTFNVEYDNKVTTYRADYQNHTFTQA